LDKNPRMKSDNDLISASLETQKDKNITQAPFSERGWAEP
jgi:hypothetical protein